MWLNSPYQPVLLVEPERQYGSRLEPEPIAVQCAFHIFTSPGTCHGAPWMVKGIPGLRFQFIHNLFYVSNWHMARYQLCIIIIIII